MKTAETFVFNSYKIDYRSNQISFSYEIVFDSSHIEKLVEKWSLPTNFSLSEHDSSLDQVLKAIHIAVGISYFKTFYPNYITVTKGLSGVEADFWNNVYEKGLAEFRYVNKIKTKPAKFMANTNTPSISNFTMRDSASLGIGGGKDSIVAGELLKKLGIRVSGFTLDTGSSSGQTSYVSQVMGIDDIHIGRYLDKKLFELEDAYDGAKGHIPISVLFALSGVLCAILEKQMYAVVGNESGSSIPNLVWNAQEVNHQWSKSLEFEESFQKFVHQTITPNVSYFSPIRQLSSVAITKIFSQMPEYFDIFTSCNYVLRIDPTQRPEGRWCKKCDKCLSSFLLFAAWLPEETVINMFNGDLLNDHELKNSLLALLGFVGSKPLNCVGTPEELLASFAQLVDQGKFLKSRLTTINEVQELPQHETINSFLIPAIDNAIPSELKEPLYDLLKKLL